MALRLPRYRTPPCKGRRSVRSERPNTRAELPPETEMTTAELERIERRLWPQGERRDTWMIVDAARDQRVYPLILACHLDYSCLYTAAPRSLEHVAPYLVRLDYEDRDTRGFLERGWGNSWGVLLRSDARLERLRGHLRRLLTVRDPAGRRLLFRYYDPRVLRLYLPSCWDPELREIFGPIERFWCEDRSGRELLEFAYDGALLERRSLPLG